MTKDRVWKPVFDILLTTRQADMFVAKIEKVIELLYAQDGWQTKMEKVLNQHDKDILSILFNQNDVDLADANEVADFCRELIAVIQSLPVITVVTNPWFSLQSLHRIALVSQKEFESKLLFDWKSDDLLIGGVKIYFNGEIRDYGWNQFLSKLEDSGMIAKWLEEIGKGEK